jgi:hypothetical protein
LFPGSPDRSFVRLKPPSKKPVELSVASMVCRRSAPKRKRLLSPPRRCQFRCVNFRSPNIWRVSNTPKRQPLLVSPPDQSPVMSTR